MNTLVVVENTARWPFAVAGVEVVTASAYLTQPRWAELRHATVFNICRHYGYQRRGYYVSLLAAARGHRPFPSVETVQKLRLAPIVRILAEDLADLVRRALAPLKSDTFVLSVYFGRNPAKRYDRLCQELFNQFPAPFLRAFFARDADGWQLQSIRLIATSDIPDTHRTFVLERAAEFLKKRPRSTRRTARFQYDLAILWDEKDDEAPSDERAIKKFVRAGRTAGLDVSVIGPDEYGSLAEFDALFIRQTTYLNHHTYRFAQRAASEGLVVIDDPQSIIRCTNKVYQAEVFDRFRIPAPKTRIVEDADDDTLDAIISEIGFPCVLKRPDSSFSQGVVKAADAESVRKQLELFLADSELVVVQAFTPSDFDWRIGVLNGEPLYAAKYHMVPGHWQIIDGRRKVRRYGKVQALAVEEVPKKVVQIATRSASHFGDGLYGVDLKEFRGRIIVTEVNDNPSIDAGYEDAILGMVLYDRIMGLFRERLDRRGQGNS